MKTIVLLEVDQYSEVNRCDNVVLLPNCNHHVTDSLKLLFVSFHTAFVITNETAGSNTPL
jgi:hypothetical protein